MEYFFISNFTCQAKVLPGNGSCSGCYLPNAGDAPVSFRFWGLRTPVWGSVMLQWPLVKAGTWYRNHMMAQASAMTFQEEESLWAREQCPARCSAGTSLMHSGAGGAGGMEEGLGCVAMTPLYLWRALYSCCGPGHSPRSEASFVRNWAVLGLNIGKWKDTCLKHVRGKLQVSASRSHSFLKGSLHWFILVILIPPCSYRWGIC